MDKIFYMNASEILDSVFAFYKKSFWKHIGASFIFGMVCNAIIITLLFFVMTAGLFYLMTDGWATGGFAALAASFAVFFLLFPALTGLGNIALTGRLFQRKDNDLGKAVSDGFKGLMPAITGVMAKFILCFPLVYLSARLIIWGGGRVFGLFLTPIFGSGYWTVGALTLILVLAVALAGVALAAAAVDTFFIILLPVCVFERKYFFPAVFRAFRLIKQDYARLFRVNLLWFAVSSLFSAFITMPVQILASALGDTTFGILLVMFNLMLSQLVSFVTTPLSGIFYSTVYMNQRVRHEGLDIEMRLEALGGRS